MGAKRLEHALVAKFTTEGLSLSSLQDILLGTWQPRGTVSLGFLDDRHVLIVFDCNEDVVNALISPLRKAGDSFFRLFRWTADFSVKKESPITTTWIRLPKLHPALLFAGYAKDIASSIGNFLCEEVLPASNKQFRSPRICLEVDLAKPLPSHIWIDSKVRYWQRVVYEGKLAFCSKCKFHGHSLDSCLKAAKKTSPIHHAAPYPPNVVPNATPNDWTEVIRKRRRKKKATLVPPPVVMDTSNSSPPIIRAEVAKKKHRRTGKKKQVPTPSLIVQPSTVTQASSLSVEKVVAPGPPSKVSPSIPSVDVEVTRDFSDSSPPIHEVFGKVKDFSKKEISYRTGIRFKETICSFKPVRILKRPVESPAPPIYSAPVSSPKGYTTEEFEAFSSGDEEEGEFNALGLPFSTADSTEASTSPRTSS